MNAKRIWLALIVSAIATGPAYAAQDRTLMLMNNSSLPVIAFSVKPVDGSTELLDVLAGQALPARANRKVTIPSPTDNCAFDLEIVFSAEEVAKREAVDFCNTDGYIIEKQ